MSDDINSDGASQLSTQELLAKLIDQGATLADQVSTLTDRVSSLTDQVSTLTDRVSSLTDRMDRVEAALGIGEAETLPLSGRVNRLIHELAEFKQEVRESFTALDNRLDGMERSLAAIQGDAVRRWSRLDERMQILENPPEVQRS